MGPSEYNEEYLCEIRMYCSLLFYCLVYQDNVDLLWCIKYGTPWKVDAVACVARGISIREFQNGQKVLTFYTIIWFIYYSIKLNSFSQSSQTEVFSLQKSIQNIDHKDQWR